MKTRRLIFLLAFFMIVVLLIGGGMAYSGVSSQLAPARPLPSDFPGSPILFVQNAGQWPEPARFQIWGGPAGTMWLAEDAIWLTFVEHSTEPAPVDSPSSSDSAFRSPQFEIQNWKSANIKLTFAGANPHPIIEPYGRLETTVSYFIGSDPEQWRPEVPVWSGVRYVDVWPGIDLVLADKAGRWGWWWEASVEADLDVVRLRVEGAEVVRVEGGALVLHTEAGAIALSLPAADFLYRIESVLPDGRAQSTEISPALGSDQIAPQPEAGLLPVADPSALLFSTYLGGAADDETYGFDVNAAGDVYIIGTTRSSNFPTTPGASDRALGGVRDAVVARINAEGNHLVYAAFLGGNGSDWGFDIAVDEASSAYLTGYTASSDFPTSANAYDRSLNGGRDVFLAQLNDGGSSLLYSTFLGGSGDDDGYGIALDSTGGVTVGGGTESSNFPTTAGASDTSYNGGRDAFLARFTPGVGPQLVYSSYFGGAEQDDIEDIVMDGSRTIFAVGGTNSTGFPTTVGAYDRSHNGGRDIFVVKLNPDGGLGFSTFLGGSSDDDANGIAVDGDGRVYVAGGAGSAD
ncbi:MAG: SBBP repeat-containing protein, partial [Caldilineales bacterium]|nr:SBBP repeat-containing protein [Caldilineales bacterium]